MKIVSIFFLLVFSLKAQATISNFQIISGTSNEFNLQIGEQDAWGVMAGPNTDPTGEISVDFTRPYNSCELPTAAAAPFSILPCHPRRVDGPTVISIQFNETSDFNGARPATAVLSPVPTQANPNPLPIELTRSTALFVSGQPVSFEFTWSDICSEVVFGPGTFMNSEGQCQRGTDLISGNVPIRIGLNDGSINGQVSSQEINFRLYNPGDEVAVMPLGDSGPCNFSTEPDEISGVCEIFPIPGDSGAFLETSLEGDPRQTRFLGANLTYEDAFNNNQAVNLNYIGIRLYFFESADPQTYFPFSGTARVADLDISSPVPVTLEDDRISGLTNGVTYTVLASSIDESGTISQFLLPVTSGLGTGYCNSVTDATCPSVTPSQVAGVIVDSSCFITTATYGSKSAHQVQTFQKFRETFLRGQFLGDHLINLYESYGPHAAVFIKNNSYLKPFVRAVLFPFYLFSKLSLRLGLLNGFLIFGIFLFALITAFRWRLNR